MAQSLSAECRAVHHFVLVTEGRDLLDDANLEALYLAGCTDASIGHRTVEFDREAPTRWDAIQQAIRDVAAVSGLRVVDVRDSIDTVPTGPTAPSRRRSRFVSQ
ncbi:hypothetical protein [Candidatus Poriferisodalis sp.]|uniref:hypothetical protein n=1 Tax=Candidatus Poriferisodalis sp. TaxID=3101277 RepID=UPI003B0179B0